MYDKDSSDRKKTEKFNNQEVKEDDDSDNEN